MCILNLVVVKTKQQQQLDLADRIEKAQASKKI
ncbi:hypothetical protein H1P_1220014 [Hyella patelloides LEGE 07179]|uniref:Uncharacterized protein n=1 Tax=Hyella patelloides LEGE 07179 TaxID=945734 RepID=A0A563VKL4_9CYAN|nr:hypothetical protein H1P_1220014 [Hyella patelloides LEGE 07179]